MAVINLTEPTGIPGHEIATKIASRLNFILIDQYFIINEINKTISSIKSIVEMLNTDKELPDTFKKIIINQALKNNAVILNLGGELLFHDIPGTLNVKISTKSTDKSLPRETRLKTSNFKKFVKLAFGLSRIDNSYYDLQFKLDNMDTDFGTELILKAADMKAVTSKAGITWKAINKLKKNMNKNTVVSVISNSFDHKIPDFAHPSEREFAKMLDYYRVRWEYEPRSFILEKNSNGKIKEEFTPDFYLADMDLYIELTTMKQKLVTKKNRKLKKLKQLYPDINIKIFYGKDYEKLLHRFGIKKSDSK